MPESYDSMMNKALDACEESFTVPIPEITPMYIALQDAVKAYVESEDNK